MLAEFLEVGMMIAFGCAWPASILKSLRTRSAKGKSLSFLCIVLFGYCCGIGAKFASGALNYVVIFYIINFLAVATDLALYFRNARLDRLALVVSPAATPDVGEASASEKS